ncbi:MAG: DUF2953 domain-containing protein, partial [Lachnospiraceae bacterium]|nr:DUF2953 domain-containing protein [Lachnospiraceae bacterium]
ISLIFENTGQKIKNIIRKIKILINKAGNAGDLLNSKAFSDLWEYGKELLVKILKHIRIKKIKSDLVIGTGEPDSTGMVFGMIACAMGAGGFKIKATPDFDRKIFEGYFYAKGSMILGYLLILLAKAYMSKEYAAWKHEYELFQKKNIKFEREV